MVWDIASQALISGVFSLTRQAVQLGYLPRLTTVRTSATERGQIYIPSAGGTLPPALLANLRHNHVLHETVVFSEVKLEPVARALPAKRAETEHLRGGLYQVKLHFGFTERVDVPAALKDALTVSDKPSFEPADATFFPGCETLFATEKPGMALWRERLFIAVSQNAKSAASFFMLPPERVIEIGSQVEL